MLDGMNTERQIKEARQTLEELLTDEQELVTLEAEQTAEIQALKESGSKDFAALATLEGKRSALGTMLTEQRQAISEARAELASLEAQQAAAESLERYRGLAEGMRQKRTDLHAGVTALADTLEKELLRLIGIRGEWRSLRLAFIEEAQAQGVPLKRGGYHNQELDREVLSFYARLEAQGVDVEAFRLNPFMGDMDMETRKETADRLPMTREPGNQLNFYAPFGPRVGLLAAQVYQDGVQAYHMANDPKAVAYQEQKEAGYEW